MWYEGFQTGTPRETIRRAFEAGILTEDETETLLTALTRRNLLSHTYNREQAEEARNLIQSLYTPLFRTVKCPLARETDMRDCGLKPAHRQSIIDTLAANAHVERVVLFGSRATGAYHTRSDVDLALFGDAISHEDLAKLSAALDELPIPQRIDLLIAKRLQNTALKQHIATHGIEWYHRAPRR